VCICEHELRLVGMQGGLHVRDKVVCGYMCGMCASDVVHLYGNRDSSSRILRHPIQYYHHQIAWANPSAPKLLLVSNEHILRYYLLTHLRHQNPAVLPPTSSERLSKYQLIRYPPLFPRLTANHSVNDPSPISNIVSPTFANNDNLVNLVYCR
jgi:hypothetical protein